MTAQPRELPRGRVVAMVVALVVGTTSGCAVRSDTYCSDVFSEYLRQVEVERLYKEQAAAARTRAQADGPGLGGWQDPEAAALVAREAWLDLVLDNIHCFPPRYVSYAKAQERLLRQQGALTDGG